ncbi:hypothetical protein NDN08_002242 [Rhodosorus marinus]|uniref:Acyl-coenzyme A oxidase n=1 Tax=Rhodosorus marinus TaxID=101924 RepID=A0AAV8UXG7_9RHOD|nr:hypothetical protein NDN08_002242 [Rhodosorus marinus]
MEVLRLSEHLAGHHFENRNEMFALFEREPELFRPRHDLGMRESRELLMRRWERLHELGYFKNTITSRNPEDHLRRIAMSETCEYLDHSLSVKMGVNYGLFGGAVAGLGTEEQRDYWLPKVERKEIIGCYGLSELGAGSNVRGIRTTATYDPGSRSFVLHTPTDGAQKYWIGGAAESACHCSVFAYLIVDRKRRGIHGFVVQIRDSIGGSPVHGVTIADCGDKWGLNGVDNGRIWFDRVKIPRSNMLMKLSQVSEDGHYTSIVQSENELFGRTLAPLTSGRVSIIFSALNEMKVGTSIAIPYAKSRQVFDKELMSVQTHRHRLLPYVCGTLVMNIVANPLKLRLYESGLVISKKFHVLSAGLKALSTWEMERCLQECREACGGQGMLSENRVGPLLSEFNVTTTFEGDNHVMVQQASKVVVSMYMEGLKQGEFSGDLDFLNREELPLQAEPNDMSFILELMRRRVRGLLPALVPTSGTREAAEKELVLFEEVGTAFCDLLIFESFEKELNDSAGLPCKDLLMKAGLIYGLSRIDRDSTFSRSGALSSDASWSVRRTYMKELDRFVESGMMDSAIEAFRVPDFLKAPICGDWLSHNAKARL